MLTLAKSTSELVSWLILRSAEHRNALGREGLSVHTRGTMMLMKAKLSGASILRTVRNAVNCAGKWASRDLPHSRPADPPIYDLNLDQLMDMKITVRRSGMFAKRLKTVPGKHGANEHDRHYVRVTITADGPVRVIRFQDDDQMGRNANHAVELSALYQKLAAVDAELLVYQEEKGVLVNMMLGRQVWLLFRIL